jgi:hypothetical protein
LWDLTEAADCALVGQSFRAQRDDFIAFTTAEQPLLRSLITNVEQRLPSKVAWTVLHTFPEAAPEERWRLL